jgi:A/G-specific adenine glycosylase
MPPANVQSSKLSSLDSRKAGQLVPRLLDWFACNARDLPWRRTLDPYAIWVSEIMLQQTQVKTVIPYWVRWLSELPDVGTLAAAPPEKVLKLWEGLGYYTRARNLQKAAQLIAGEHAGRFPDGYEAILALPGVGRYTAGAICSLAFNQSAPILDGNVMRVLTRLFAIRENPRDKAANEMLWQLATQLVQRAIDTKFKTKIPKLKIAGSCSALNQSLMELGATVCTPRKPNCSACPVRAHCAALKGGLVESLPNLGQRAGATPRFFHTFIVRWKQRCLVQKRPEGVVNSGLWEFPNTEVESEQANPAVSATLLGFGTVPPEPFAIVRHSITRYRITQAVFSIAGRYTRPAKEARASWLALDELRRLPFTSAHKKLLGRVFKIKRGLRAPKLASPSG